MRWPLYLLGALCAFAAAFLLWEASYALAVAWRTHNWLLWLRFTRGFELLLPLRAAQSEWGDPVVQNLVARATLGATIAVVVVSVIAMQIVHGVRAMRPPLGGSRLATLKDLQKADLLNGEPGYSIFLGRFSGKDVRYSGASHIYVNGPTRSGKGVGFVLPNALEWRGSLIGLDIKREMWTQIGAARAAMGQRVFLFSPGSAESHCWNPLDLVSGWPERATDVANIARSLIPTPATGDSYWAETARGLFAGLLGYVLDSDTMRGQRTIKSALKMMSQGRSLAAVMAEILVAEPDLNEFVADKFRQHIGREEKQRMSFEAHIVTALDGWNNELVDDATSRSDFNISDLRRKPFTILIGTPVGNFGSVEAVVRLLVQQVHDVLLRSLPGLDEPHKLLLMLDEFYQFGRMPEIVDRAPLVAGYGFQIAVIAQGLTQLDVRYGKPTRDMLVGNMDVKVLIGVGDETTAKYCSDEIGKQYIRREGWGTSIGGGSLVGGMPRASRTTQGRWELEPLMPPEALRRLDSKKSLLLVRGQYAAVLEKINFFTDRGYKRKVAASAPFGAQLSVPDVGTDGLSSDWSADAGATIVSAANGAKHDAAFARVMAAAEKIFVDAGPFRAAFVAAMNEASNEPVAALCKELRTEPQSIAVLKQPRRFSIRCADPPDVLTKSVRAEIVAARNLLNADRAERMGIAHGGSGSDDVSGAARVCPPVETTPPPPPLVVANAGVGGSEVEKVREPVDMVALVAGVSAEAAEWVEEVKATVASTMGGEKQAEFNADVARLDAAADLFQDTPDDLRELLTA
ncbi:type IV secretory system conjugative DNA transfer family protein [Methylocystis parvus]|uniref:Type IV secretory system conjugative DNA transfer family protein n=1 Tax=Methylocystis parvus TaxID=134 RepID=A0A6B8M487_9HYPH|nr:type IV secretory system conjugative DNA transfer family protein [Methylocystis parvus]QGM99817.1 type IV secretory system conjugative DNA transfer family protein [Methylocystis parvus]WBK02237.1 type IV secretory system conjugative DNA transfer family protein [Methylocystis parvus OBBP]